MKSSPKITIVNLAEALNVSRRTIQRDLESLRNAQKSDGMGMITVVPGRYSDLAH